jgi:pantoate--beta-alanine ligase
MTVQLLARQRAGRASCHVCSPRTVTLFNICSTRRRPPNVRPLATSTTNLQPVLPFRIVEDVPALRNFRKDLLMQRRTVGLVPTMGALHAGHLALIRAAAKENSDVFVSIFVNPTQFGVNEDLASYPQTWESDMAKLGELDKELAQIHPRIGSSYYSGRALVEDVAGRIAAIFHPSVQTMYPTLPPTSEETGDGSFVLITPLGKKLEGASRPVFFRGVATVCTKLFNIVQPDRVYFGQKDVQQSVVIKRMVQDFHIPAAVRVMPTTREKDGLAMSSRNVYLGELRRRQATILYKALKAAEAIYESGNCSRQSILDAAEDAVGIERLMNKKSQAASRVPFEFVYLSLADTSEMDEIEDMVDPTRGAILSGAVKMMPVIAPQNDEELAQKPVRLIDNIILKPR